MKNLIYLIGVVGILLTGCTPELPELQTNSLQEVTFTSGDNFGMKTDPFNCDNDEPDYAEIIMQGGSEGNLIGEAFTKRAPVFHVDGIMFTQAIKLAPGEYTVLNFLLYAESTDGGDDVLVNAVPEADSEFGALVANPLPHTFLVSAFLKVEVPLGVLCFEETVYQQFGFAWFRVDETKGHQKWFFGDFCTKFYKDYAGSLYGNDPKVDMPAIFKIELYYDDNNSGGMEDDEIVNTFSNQSDYLTSGTPLAVNYLDPIPTGDLYELRVFIYVKTGDDNSGTKQFVYKNFGSWYFEDDSFELFTDSELSEGEFDSGTDGVYDFVLGNCTVDAADFAFAPYMNLPETATLLVGSDYAPGPEGNAYLDIKLSGFNTGFDIETSFWYGSYCFDQSIDITGGESYEVTVFSSLLKQLLPEVIRNKRWEEVNWLANHLEDFPGYTWEDLQQAIWELENDSYNYSDNNGSGFNADEDMVDDMVSKSKLYGAGYIPMPGGWAAVTFVKTADLLNGLAVPSIQTVFIIVDP